MKIHRCSICNIVWKDSQLNKGKCPQDGGKVRDISKTKAGKRLIEMFKRMEKT